MHMDHLEHCVLREKQEQPEENLLTPWHHPETWPLEHPIAKLPSFPLLQLLIVKLGKAGEGWY